jgi:hypothetical protein
MYDNYHTKLDCEFGINVAKACEAGMTPERFSGEARRMLVIHGPRPPESVRLKNNGQIIGGASGRTIWLRLTVSQKPLSPDFRNRKDALLLYAR